MKSNWENYKLGAICTITAGQSPKGSFYNKQGKGKPFYQGKKDFGEKFLAEPKVWTTQVTKIALANDILMSVRAPVGSINICNTEICIGRGLASIRPGKTVLRDFLYYFLLINKTVGNKGAVFDSINKAQIENIVIFLPPIDEQKQVVSVLDRVFNDVEKAKETAQKNLQNSQYLFDSYSQKAFENPGTWEKVLLGEVCELFQGLAINEKTKHLLVEKSDFPLLRIKDLINNSVEQYVDPKNYPESTFVKESDLIYTRTGQVGLVFTGKRGILHNNSFKIDPDKKRLSSEYLYWWLQNPVFRNNILSLAYRAAQPDITHKIFKQQPISIPPLFVQTSIVNKLRELNDNTNRLKKLYEHKFDYLGVLRQSVLSKAFSGEL